MQIVSTFREINECKTLDITVLKLMHHHSSSPKPIFPNCLFFTETYLSKLSLLHRNLPFQIVSSSPKPTFPNCLFFTETYLSKLSLLYRNLSFQIVFFFLTTIIFYSNACYNQLHKPKVLMKQYIYIYNINIEKFATQ